MSEEQELHYQHKGSIPLAPALPQASGWGCVSHSAQGWNPPDKLPKRLKSLHRQLRAVHWGCLIINLSYLLLLTVLFQEFNNHTKNNLGLFSHWYMVKSSNRRTINPFYLLFFPLLQHDIKTVSCYADIQPGTGFHSKWTSMLPYILLIQFFHVIPNSICWEFCPKGV